MTMRTLRELTEMGLLKRGRFKGAPLVSDGVVWELSQAGIDHLAASHASSRTTPAPSRQEEIQAELRSHGYRMESSLSALDDDDDGEGAGGHAVLDIQTEEIVDDEVLHGSPRLLALAEEWSRIENANAGTNHVVREREREFQS